MDSTTSALILEVELLADAVFDLYFLPEVPPEADDLLNISLALLNAAASIKYLATVDAIATKK